MRESFEQTFRRVTAGSKKLTCRMLILVSWENGMQLDECCLLLERTGLAKSGSLVWFQINGGITQEQIDEVLQGKIGLPLRPMEARND